MKRIRGAIHVGGAEKAPAAVPPAPSIPLIPLALPGLRKQKSQTGFADGQVTCVAPLAH